MGFNQGTDGEPTPTTDEGLKKEFDILTHGPLNGHRVLIRIYISPQQTKSGLFKGNRNESYSSNEGQVIMVNSDYNGTYKVGDWVSIPRGDRTKIQNIDVCYLFDDQPYQVISDPRGFAV